MVNDTGDNEGLFELEVAYAKSEEQVIVTVKVPQGTTIEQAVNLTDLLARFPEIGHSELKVGIFGVVCKPEQTVKQGDRVEIYRPLIHDPKEARRQRALKK
ncbi:RnfH family protein [Methyloglobulus sp.]|uniref:RnfH family protein n=1 Tax=Methyloglobulus sp. TaxID=2518622 RepID=UPI0039890268